MIMPFIDTTSSRDIQRNYRAVVDKIKKTKRPIVVIRRNQPEVALVSLDLLKEYEELKSSADWSVIEAIGARNKDKDPDEVWQDVTADVEEVRKRLYEQKKTTRRH